MGRKVATRWYAHHPIQYNTGNHDILGIISTVIRAFSGYNNVLAQEADYLYGHDV